MAERSPIERVALWVCLGFVAAGCDPVVGIDDPEILGSGRVVTEVRTLASFNGIEARGGYEVQIKLATTERVEITTDDNVVGFIRTDVIDGTLVIASDSTVRLFPTEPIVVQVSAADVTRLSASGAMLVSADIGAVDGLTVTVSGVSRVRVLGSAPWQTITISGVGSYNGRGFETGETRITASGVSFAEVWANDLLDVTGSGVSTVRYLGEPSVIARVSGWATVAPASIPND